MKKLNASFESVWSTSLEPKARALGAIDGDLDRVRAAAKSLMITAGWTNNTGDCSFVNEGDLSNCLSATVQLVENTTKSVVAQRRVVTAKAGFGPTKAQVVAGSARALVSASAPTVELTSTQVAASNFAPAMARVGDRCPRCSGSMEPVGLVNERAGLYCPRDRVVLPLPADQSVRD